MDLSKAQGLETVVHRGPSVIDHRTLLQSGPLSLHPSWRGCGLPDRLIDYVPSLLEAGPIQFYSCFISYSTANQEFAERLHADLQARGVRCWFAPHDMQAGKKIHDQIDEAIRVYDKLLLILSEASMTSTWVKTEVAKARKKEVASEAPRPISNRVGAVQRHPRVETVRRRPRDDTAREVREYFLPDFSEWKTNHDAYQRSLEKVVAALKNADVAVSDVTEVGGRRVGRPCDFTTGMACQRRGYFMRRVR